MCEKVYILLRCGVEIQLRNMRHAVAYIVLCENEKLMRLVLRNTSLMLIYRALTHLVIAEVHP